MEKKEELEIVEQEDEMISAEMANLLSSLNSEIAYGEALGVFTPKEASEWYAGAAACTKIAHLRELLDRHIGKVIASGEARLRKLEQTVDNDLLTASEQLGYLNAAQRTSYQEKGQLIEDIKDLLKELANLRLQLIAALDKKKIPASEKGNLINKFYSADANHKSAVAKEAEIIELIENKPEQIAKEKTIETPNPALETAEPAVEIKKDPKTECLDLVELYLEHSRFRQAADLIEASSRYFNLVEYRGWLKKIEKARLAKEIPELMMELGAA